MHGQGYQGNTHYQGNVHQQGQMHSQPFHTAAYPSQSFGPSSSLNNQGNNQQPFAMFEAAPANKAAYTHEMMNDLASVFANVNLDQAQPQVQRQRAASTNPFLN